MGSLAHSWHAPSHSSWAGESCQGRGPDRQQAAQCLGLGSRPAPRFLQWGGGEARLAGQAPPGNAYKEASPQAHLCPIRSRPPSKFRKVPAFSKGLHVGPLTCLHWLADQFAVFSRAQRRAIARKNRARFYKCRRGCSVPGRVLVCVCFACALEGYVCASGSPGFHHHGLPFFLFSVSSSRLERLTEQQQNHLRLLRN